jgi:hypothetical protein
MHAMNAYYACKSTRKPVPCFGFLWIGILLCLALGAMFMPRASASRAKRV